MLFTTLAYAFFFGLVFAVHWLLPRRLRRPWLLVASYFFYMMAFPQYGLLIGLMTLGNYLLGLLLGRLVGSWRKAALISMIIGNLATLAYFKYAGFLFANLKPALRLLPSFNDDITITIILPLGISFFTFEFIHYAVEVYRGQAPIKNPIDFALFAAFFPTQIAGPIKRFPAWVKQIEEPVRLRAVQADIALNLILRGVVKKIVVADVLAPLVAQGFDDPGHLKLGCLSAWLIIYAFAAQIYADFSGYTDIGRGCALLLGYSVPENFMSPYQARDPSDFWNRWHRSLSSWLRDYLYIPLGGSRVPRARLYLNLMITMGLGGLWHGASWHFMLWGLYQGSLLVGHRQWQQMTQQLPPAFQRWKTTPSGVLAGRIVTFHLVCLGWVIFRADSIQIAGQLIIQALGLTQHAAWQGMLFFTPQSGLASAVLVAVSAVVVYGWIVDWLKAGVPQGMTMLVACKRLVLRWHPVLQPVFYLAMLCLIAIWPTHAAERFIYFQF